MRRPEPAEQDAQQRVGVGHRADRRAQIGGQAFLTNHDRRRQPVHRVHLGPVDGRHEALDERRVGLVDHPLRLGGDGVEDQRTLARAGDPGEHREPPLGDLDVHVLEVVDPRALHPDHVVAVGWVAGGRHGAS